MADECVVVDVRILLFVRGKVVGIVRFGIIHSSFKNVCYLTQMADGFQLWTHKNVQQFNLQWFDMQQQILRPLNDLTQEWMQRYPTGLPLPTAKRCDAYAPQFHIPQQVVNSRQIKFTDEQRRQMVAWLSQQPCQVVYDANLTLVTKDTFTALRHKYRDMIVNTCSPCIACAFAIPTYSICNNRHALCDEHGWAYFEEHIQIATKAYTHGLYPYVEPIACPYCDGCVPLAAVTVLEYMMVHTCTANQFETITQFLILLKKENTSLL